MSLSSSHKVSQFSSQNYPISKRKKKYSDQMCATCILWEPYTKGWSSKVKWLLVRLLSLRVFRLFKNRKVKNHPIWDTGINHFVKKQNNAIIFCHVDVNLRYMKPIRIFWELNKGCSKKVSFSECCLFCLVKCSSWKR